MQYELDTVGSFLHMGTSTNYLDCIFYIFNLK